MRKNEFTFTLPEALIAQHPLEQRQGSRLLCLDRVNGEVAHRQFSDLVHLLSPGDLLVFNDTRVIPARLFGRKETGGRVEILLERLLPENCCIAQLRVSKKPPEGSIIVLEGGARLRVEGRDGGFFRLALDQAEADSGLSDTLEREGHIPLPPYIDRNDDEQDRERYQTVYARRPGAVAAPTAGLHFDEDLLRALEHRGVERAYVTLHVGAGTFQPVRSERIEDHEMHAEHLEVGEATVEAIRQTKARGNRVIAVGTTTVRSLETAARDGVLKPFCGDSNIFIYPGHEFQVIDAMITNFHLPESTLIMLVSAFAGREAILSAYEAAVQERYRFFSYGDAMLLC